MNLNEVLKVSKELSPDSLHDMLFARKLSARPTETVTVSGYPCVLENSAGKPVVDYRIYGNSVQNDTPTPENSVLVQSFGDLITDGEYAGKYKIPVVASTENNVPKTTNIYLDEPLRKIGDYADVIDFERGVAERKINKIVFDGTEDFRAHSTLKGWFQLLDNTVLVGRLACCTHFYYTYSANSMPEGSFTTVNPIGNTGRYVFNMSDETTLDDFKIFLASEYAKGTPVTVYYALAESTTEPISIPSIPTFDGTTIITTDTEIQPSNMEITYKARK